ncbi:MAG: acetylglutamate kinase [Oscillospiraceae bacterium]|nr:acetylglutamate kinase [Oscillospiraceae bacterium]
MTISTSDRALVLTQALPYIKEYAGQTVVIKYGGGAMVSPELKAAVMQDVVLLSTVGIRVVLVHGGGPEIDDAMKRLGKEPTFVGGLRYTDEETMAVVETVLAGRVNKSLVADLQQHGGSALGLCGLDGGLLTAAPYKRGELGLVGEVTHVNTQPLNTCLDSGFIPVIAPIGADAEGRHYNINADSAAAHIAAAMGAKKLVLMTDVIGILRDKDDDSSLISVIHVSEVPALKKQGVVSGGMLPKVDCCVEAVRRGVHRTHVIDGRIPHSILIEMLTDEGIGTMFL